MKALGISAVVLTVLSFLLYAANWLYFRLLYSSEIHQGAINYISQTVGVLSVVTQYIAILLISIGLILLAGRLSKN